CLGNIACVFWDHRICDSEVRRRVLGNDGQSVGEVVNHHQLKWLGHVLRIPEHRLPRRSMLTSVEDGWNKCFKLPSFLLSTKYSELSTSSFKSPVIPDLIDSTDNNINEKMFIENYPHSADMIIQSRNSKSSKSLKSSSSLSSSTSSIKSHKINRPHSHNEGLVVPAALGGSHRSTAYMRLNNRVRIIERNVSVSMRYLEELSQSYRRQMERLARSFNLTYAWLKVTAHSAEERDRQQQVS
ncbi:unnamed protein product, partial [Schistosoma mattheei]